MTGEELFLQAFKQVLSSVQPRAHFTIHGFVIEFRKYPKFGGGEGVATYVDGRRVKWQLALEGVQAFDKAAQPRSEISEGE
jgi:hypothetical protein